MKVDVSIKVFVQAEKQSDKTAYPQKFLPVSKREAWTVDQSIESCLKKWTSLHMDEKGPSWLFMR